MKNAYIMVFENDDVWPSKVCLDEMRAKKFVINYVTANSDPDWVQEQMENTGTDTIEKLCEFYDYDPDFLGCGYYPIPLLE